MAERLTVTKDRLDEVLKSIHSFADSEVMVGFPESTAQNNVGPKGEREGEATNPQLAYIHEFGAPANNIPARPFLVPGVNDVRDKIAKVLVHGVKKALAGDKSAISNALNQAGNVGQGGVQQKLATGPFAPLSDVTILAREAAGRPSTKPLIDTGAMRQAVSYVIRPRKKG